MSTNVYTYQCIYLRNTYIHIKYVYIYIYIDIMQLHFTHNFADLEAENLKQAQLKLFKYCAKARN